MSDTADKRQHLAPEQLKALESLLDGDTYAEAAKVAGVSLRTVYRWVLLPEFKEAFDEQRGAVMHRCAIRLNRLAEIALDSYSDCSQPVYPHRPPRRGHRDNRNPQAIRLAAANSIMDRIGVVAVKASSKTPEELESTDPQQLREALKARGFVQLDDLSSDELEALAAKKREAETK